MGNDFLAPTLWDAPPFAVSLHHAFAGKVFDPHIDINSCIRSVRSQFFGPSPPPNSVSKIQKFLAAPIKGYFYPENVLTILSKKAAKQKILMSSGEISNVLTSISDHPFILSATFIKVLTNALCTTARIKNHPTTKCFVCGKHRDDLYHFLRCPCVAFIFKLPPAFGSLHFPYFPVVNLARHSILFETNYIVMEQFGPNILASEFPFKANNIVNIAKHVAIKNKLSRLSHSTTISYSQAEEFISKQARSQVDGANILDAALL